MNVFVDYKSCCKGGKIILKFISLVPKWRIWTVRLTFSYQNNIVFLLELSFQKPIFNIVINNNRRLIILGQFGIPKHFIETPGHYI